MYLSGEVRWFFRGESSRDVHQWFEAGGRGRSEPERTDEYLLLPDCETVSVKLRDGKFEIKACTKAPAQAEYADKVCGLRDTWVKWSSSAGDVDQFRSQFVRAEDDWANVTKKRHLRLFSLESDSPAEIAVGQSWLSRGCQVELTDIRVQSARDELSPAETWWSLSFESFGDSETLLESLDLVVPAFFLDMPPVTLNYKSSLSYPAWLNRLG